MYFNVKLSCDGQIV